MDTVTIPKESYKLLEKQAALLRGFLTREISFPVERYSAERMAAFLTEDRIDAGTRRKAGRMLKKKM